MGIFHELLRCFLPTEEAFIFMWILALMGLAALYITIKKWISVNRSTDYNAPVLFEKIKSLIDSKKTEEAYQICVSAGSRALPMVLCAGIKKTMTSVEMVHSSMIEESTHISAVLERGLSYLVMFGNASTLMGLLGTVFGLIMSFAAVGQPGVAAVEKSALLASGISTAMNSTLVGLSISVPSVLAYSILRSKVDQALVEIDCYAIAVLKLLVPADISVKGRQTLVRRSRDGEEAADTDVTPMLNLMVMLIPFLLTSSEFVKIGAIELKLPESTEQSAGIQDGPVQQENSEVKLDLGIVITQKGFTVYHYFRKDSDSNVSAAEKKPDIPCVKDEYNYRALNNTLAEIKKKAVLEILKQYKSEQANDISLFQLSRELKKIDLSGNRLFSDNECIKIVAEDQIKYDVIVKVMDAVRGINTDHGEVTMFPDVSIAGGIIQ